MCSLFEECWSSNFQDIRNLFFRCTSVCLYGWLVFMFFLELSNSGVETSILIDMLSIKNSGYESRRTT